VDLSEVQCGLLMDLETMFSLPWPLWALKIELHRTSYSTDNHVTVGIDSVTVGVGSNADTLKHGNILICP